MNSTDGCWLYAGTIHHTGYGVINGMNNKPLLVHRIMYENFKGEIPPKMDIDHICNNPPCINPDHLQALTHHDNMRKNYKPNHCNREHELTIDNVYTWVKKTGLISRRCKTCHRAWCANRKKRRKAAKLERSSHEHRQS